MKTRSLLALLAVALLLSSSGCLKKEEKKIERRFVCLNGDIVHSKILCPENANKPKYKTVPSAEAPKLPPTNYSSVEYLLGRCNDTAYFSKQKYKERCLTSFALEHGHPELCEAHVNETLRADCLTRLAELEAQKQE